LLGELRRASMHDGLALYYQPKVSHQTSQITGVEALVRWLHPRYGLLGPSQFLPFAEQSGLGTLLNQTVLNAALRQCRQWVDAGLSLPVAVNLSMRELHDTRLPDTIAQLLDRWHLSPALLCVEITEEAVMADPDGTLLVLTLLRQLGVQLAIDDFGTGYSSLAQLKRLPVSQIKIDQAFVRDMAVNDNDAVIVRSTIELGHNLGLTVVAEGIEDLVTWERLTSLGCDEGQGYYLSYPMPAEDLVRWVSTRGRRHALPV
ncbi:MAG TPA: EAL domain-containing protein, partial [Chloroflexia bacterium]|nr:EAL domain-containing protein [Chloroflexia bacterium]